jgi:hypothetical protein
VVMERMAIGACLVGCWTVMRMGGRRGRRLGVLIPVMRLLRPMLTPGTESVWFAGGGLDAVCYGGHSVSVLLFYYSHGICIGRRFGFLGLSHFY